MKKFISLILSLSMAVSLLSFPPVFAQGAYIPTLTVKMDVRTGAMRHGSGGFLYGLGSVGTPSVNTLTPLKPSTAVQKAPDGLQHPTGDVLDVASTFISAGGEQVQVYLQDIYALWPYEYTGMDEYLEHIKVMIPKLVDFRAQNPNYNGKIVYVPFNEPDGIWYNNINSSASVQNNFNNDWKTVYDLIHSLDPDALIGGTSCANYQGAHFRSWLSFCVDNNCEPDYITWHELQDYDLNSFKANLDDYRSIEASLGMSEREIIINEYAPQDHCSNPGKLVNWIALFEENKVSGCLPYWHNAGNLNDLAADNNEPNGAWWLYKWYGDMSGETLSLSTNTARTEFYGLASIDDNKKSSNVIFGGADGTGQIVLQNITSAEMFKNLSSADVKVEASYWTSFHGVAPTPDTIIKGNYKIENDTLTVTIPNMKANTAYNLIITPPSADSVKNTVYYGEERLTFEAENGILKGSAYPNNQKWTYAYSGGYRVSGIQSENDGYDIDISLPKTGFYKTELIYSNGYGLNTADPSMNDPKALYASISFDKEPSDTIILENTLRDEMAGMYTDYIYLTKGEHTFSVRGSRDNKGSFSNDCISFTYVGGSIPEFNSVYEAELGDFNILSGNLDTTLTTQSDIAGYTGSGYIKGLDLRSVPQGGGVRFTVVVPENSLYTIALYYCSNVDTAANIYLDNTALELDNLLYTLSLPKTDGFDVAGITAFLQKGINIIDIDSTGDISLDSVRIKQADCTPIIQEAESGMLSGGNIQKNPFAQNSYYVSDIQGGTDDLLTLNISAPYSGNYKMVIRHSSSEIFGAHTYNAQLVDRYASFKVNDDAPQRLYFKNTYSCDNWRTSVLKVKLNEGENLVKVYNDNYRSIKCGTGSTGNIDYQTLVNYTPNFDVFEFYPEVADGGERSANHKISVMSTEHGYAEIDKTLVSHGEDVKLTLFPDYKDGSITVLANKKDISYLLEDNTLTYTPTSDTEFLISFTLPENLDSSISNSSFGTGDFTDWDADNSLIVSENGKHYASIGTLKRIIPTESGYYDLSFAAKGENLTLTLNGISKLIPLTDAWQVFTVRTFAQDSISLTLSGNACVDDFSLSSANIDPDILYFADCGDIDPSTINEEDSYGICNSVTDQFYSPDPATGYSWGIVDIYAPSEQYPQLLTGSETWPYEYNLQDGTDKVITYRYAKNQDDRTGNGITYKFELPEEGEYAFEVAFYAPSHWMSVNRKSSLTVNGIVLAEGVIPKSDPNNPVIVKKVAHIDQREAVLNLKLDADGVGGCMISYIKISRADKALPETKLDIADFVISGSSTWNNDPQTAAKYAFDNNTQTFFDGISGGSLTVDLGYITSIASIGFIPRTSWANRMTATNFLVSNDASHWEKLFCIPTAPAEGEEHQVSSNEFLTKGKFRYIKYENPYDYCNVAEIFIYKEKDSLQFLNLDPSICTINDITMQNGSYYLDYESSSDSVIILCEKKNGTLSFAKTYPLCRTLSVISPDEEIYIWDKKTLKPLVLIKK